jgi:hypothetical protein
MDWDLKTGDGIYEKSEIRWEADSADAAEFSQSDQM